MINRSIFNAILGLTNSICGNYLLVADAFGCISIVNLRKIVKEREFPSIYAREPKLINAFRVKIDTDKDIIGLIAEETYLIVGTLGFVCGYIWHEVYTKPSPKPDWEIKIPCPPNSIAEQFFITDVKFDEIHAKLYIGCCDTNVYEFNLTTFQFTRTLSAHQRRINCIAQSNDVLLSAAIDGVVNKWDLRTGDVISCLCPHEDPRTARPNLGSYITDIDYKNELMVCGGGPRLALWDYRINDLSVRFPVVDEGIHVSKFLGHDVIGGGRSDYFYHMNIGGDIFAQIPTSSMSTYGAHYQVDPFEALVLTGSSPMIDISTDMETREYVFTLP